MGIAPDTRGIELPPELEPTREAARRALGKLLPAQESTSADSKFLFNAQRTEAGRKLPPYYLVYFLLVDLLGFRNLGRFEKLAWSIPVDFDGKAFLIEHRKFGVGVFAHDPVAENDQAREIVNLIHKGVREAEPFFEWLANRAAQESKLNVENNSHSLFTRYEFFRSSYQKTDIEATARADERVRTERGKNAYTIHFPGLELRQHARWLALAAIDAFFSWTEHVFIHVAILSGTVTTGLEVAKLAESEWQEKFKKALSLSDPDVKKLYDQLVDIRRQLRNFIAHGAFGKQGEAFHFHSSAGAVPLLLPHKAGKSRFALSDSFVFEEAAALKVIDDFIAILWSGSREGAGLYINETGLPLILTMAADGSYARAMSSIEEMKELVDHLSARFDQATNMDW